jgi:hypothetical protein
MSEVNRYEFKWRLNAYQKRKIMKHKFHTILVFNQRRLRPLISDFSAFVNYVFQNTRQQTKYYFRGSYLISVKHRFKHYSSISCLDQIKCAVEKIRATVNMRDAKTKSQITLFVRRREK